MVIIVSKRLSQNMMQAKCPSEIWFKSGSDSCNLKFICACTAQVNPQNGFIQLSVCTLDVSFSLKSTGQNPFIKIIEI